MEMNTSIYTHTLREKKLVKDREAEQRTVELIEKVRKGSKNE